MAIAGVDTLAFPDDIEAWRRWDSRQRFGRRLMRGVRNAARGRSYGAGGPGWVPLLLLPENEPTVLVVLDVWSHSCRVAMGEPLRHLDPRRTAVLAAHPDAITAHLPGRRQLDFTGVERIPPSVQQVLTLGAYNNLAGRVEPWARRHGARFVVVQHGLITPWAPPLSDGAHVLAWSDDDAKFWASGRASVTWQTTGSQLLWNASRRPPVELTDERPLMLGQLHGTELAALAKQRLYTRFCRDAGASYRPHPNETDIFSRAQHRLMAAAGVQFETSTQPLVELGRPVVSIFSTGTLEAAQRGLPAFVHHPDPPAWLSAFWRRYRLAPYGGPPTAPSLQPELEPALAIARAVQT